MRRREMNVPLGVVAGELWWPPDPQNHYPQELECYQDLQDTHTVGWFM